MLLTIHDIDRELDDRLAERARRERTSKNQLVEQLLARAMGMPATDRDHDEFLGRWSREERSAFDQNQADNEHIDSEEWA